MKATVAAFRLGFRSEGRKKTAGERTRLASSGTRTDAPFEKSVTAPKFNSSLDWRRGERAKNVSNARILSQDMGGAERRRDPFPLKVLSRSSEAKLGMVCQEIVNYQMRGPCANSKMHGPLGRNVVRQRNFKPPGGSRLFPFLSAPPSLEEAPTHQSTRCSAKKNDAGEKRYRCCDAASHGRAWG